MKKRISKPNLKNKDKNKSYNLATRLEHRRANEKRK